MATIYEPSGLDRPCRPRNGKKFALDELQQLVGGYIEMVRIPGDVGRRIFIVDEEGRLKGLKPNVRASHLAGQLLVGNALLCSPKEVN
nr:H353 [uncultured bacterium]